MGKKHFYLPTQPKEHLIVLFLIIYINLFSQSTLLQTYSIQDGLSQNSVNCALQTPEGFLWLGTYDGLNRFDGKDFKQFNADNQSATSSPVQISRLIKALFLDHNDLIWVASSSGTVLFDRKKSSFHNVKDYYKSLELPEQIHIIKFEKDKDQNLYMLTIDNQLYVYNFKSSKMIAFSDGKSKKLITDICSDGKGNVLIASEESVFNLKNYNKNIYFTQNEIILRIANHKEKLWVLTTKYDLYEINLFTNQKLYLNKVYMEAPKLVAPNILQYHNKNLWVGSRNEGLLKIALETKKVQIFKAKSDQTSLQSNFILCIQPIDDDILIIGQSGGGFAVYDNKSYGIIKYKAETNETGFSYDNMILSLKLLNDKEIAAGTISSGILITNLETKEFRYYDVPVSEKIRPEAKNIYTIEKLGNELYMASWAGLLIFDLDTKIFKLFTSEDKQTKELTSLIHLPLSNKLLVGGYNGGLLKFDINNKKFEPLFDPENFLSRNRINVRYMQVVNNEEVWMSSELSGFLKYNLKTGKFIHYPEIFEKTGSSRHFHINGAYVWVATDSGLLQLSHKIELIKHWTKKDGLINDFIYSSFSDPEGKIWVTSNHGVSIINANDNTIINLSEIHGLQGMEYNTACIDFDNKRNVYIGGTNGFNKIIPEKTNINQKVRAPIITDLKIKNEIKLLESDVHFLDTIVLEYDENYIDINFQSPEMGINKHRQYKYRLSGVDEDFLTTDRNHANYSNLDYGTYLFEVAASNLKGEWGPSKFLTIVVKTPWYRQWWFFILKTVTVITLLYFFLNWYISQLNARTNLEKDYALRLKILELDHLRSQMNPHFLFNALNSINSFIVKNEVHLASDYLSKFSKLMRMILEHSKKKVVSLSEEMETLELYLKIENKRFENSFTYSVIIHESLNANEISIPPLIIQPFVENAIWHGLQHKKSNGHIDIKFSMPDSEKLKIEITDNGIGRDKAKALKSKSGSDKKSYGIQITKERLKSVNPDNEIIITDLYDEKGTPEGTKVILLINMSEKVK